MKTILTALCFFAFIFTSCDSNSSKDDYSIMDSTVVPKTSAIPVVAVDTQNPAMPISINQPVQINPQQQPSPVTVNAVAPKTSTAIPVGTLTQPAGTVSTVTAPGMNPPHGQPGHRCDIYVGAPLNSKPPPQPVVTQQPATTTVVTAPGMNPPHGQPNHRCDIAVGAPLNSKPATPVQSTTIQPTMIQEPVKKDSGS